MFPPSVKLVVERARRVRHWPGLFKGRLGRCPGGEIFLVAILIHHAGVPLTSSGHIAMASARRSALAATLVAWHGGDHGVDR